MARIRRQEARRDPDLDRRRRLAAVAGRGGAPADCYGSKPDGSSPLPIARCRVRCAASAAAQPHRAPPGLGTGCSPVTSSFGQMMDRQRAIAIAADDQRLAVGVLGQPGVVAAVGAQRAARSPVDTLNRECSDRLARRAQNLQNLTRLQPAQPPRPVPQRRLADGRDVGRDPFEEHQPGTAIAGLFSSRPDDLKRLDPGTFGPRDAKSDLRDRCAKSPACSYARRALPLHDGSAPSARRAGDAPHLA